MKRDGYIIEEIISRENLEESFDTVVRGMDRKESEEGQWLLAHRDEFLNEVAAELEKGEITLSPPREIDIVEHGKVRHIQVFNMKSRIKVNAVMTPVDKHIRRRFIRTTSASIKGRGMHELKAYIERDMREAPTLRYWYKFDIRKFYETVRQEFVMYCVRRMFKDERLIRIIDTLVHVIPGGIGMSMGLRASQGLCNLLLSVFLDHYLKDRYQIKHFYRYCDDGLIGASNKRFLWECRAIVRHQIESIGQEVKPNDSVFSIEDGLDFLGYKTLPTHSRLRKRIKKDFARKLKRVKSRKRRQQLTGALYGMAKHCNGVNLMRTLMYPSEFNKYKRKAQKEKRRKMKDFGSVTVNHKSVDGKKLFRGKNVSGRELDHKPFIIRDFERDVIPRREKEDYERRLAEAEREGRSTDHVKPPKPKYLASVIFDGHLRKLWTGDKEMWDDLDSAEEQGCIPGFFSMNVDYTGTYPKFRLMSGKAFGFTPPSDEEYKQILRELGLKE